MKKLNAKRTKTQIDYEFLNGTEEKLTVQSLSTKEFEDISDSRNEAGNDANKKAIRLLLCKNSPELVEKIINEQYEEGSIVDFTTALFDAVNEEKRGKSNA